MLKTRLIIVGLVLAIAAGVALFVRLLWVRLPGGGRSAPRGAAPRNLWRRRRAGAAAVDQLFSSAWLRGRVREELAGVAGRSKTKSTLASPFLFCLAVSTK